MTRLVPADEIEQIVGIERHYRVHYGRAVSAEQTLYILHSYECRDSGIDLRLCRYSQALDRGVDEGRWGDLPDRPVALGISKGHLIPLAIEEAETDG